MGLWEIREKSRSGYRGKFKSGMRGYKDGADSEAYECGFLDGIEHAIKKLEKYHEKLESEAGEHNED